MRTSFPTPALDATHRGARRATRALAAALAATAVAASGWIPSSALEHEAHAGRPSIATVQETADDGPVTWGIAPADATGSDGRSSLEVVAAPGDVVTEHVEVRNVGESELTLRVYAADGSTSDDGAYDVLSDDEESVDVGAWTTLDADELTLAPRERRVVGARIAVPDDATPGDHAGGIVAVLRSAAVTGDNSVTVDRRVGTRLHVRVDGPVEPQLSVDIESARYERTTNPFGAGRVVTEVVVRNEGNIRLAGETRVEVAGPFGTSTTTPALPLPELLPGDRYTTTVPVPSVPPLGRLVVTAEATATASGDQDLTGAVPPISTSTALWALPWVPLALVLAVAAAGTWWFRSRSGRRRPC